MTVCIRYAYAIAECSLGADRAYRRSAGRAGAGLSRGPRGCGPEPAGRWGGGARTPPDPVTARSREVPSLSAYHAADARHDPRAAPRATDPRRRRRRQDRPARAHVPRARGLRGRRGRGRPGRARRHRDAPPGAGRARPDAPRAGRAGRHPRGPPRRRGGRDADHHALGPGLHHRPDRRSRGRRRRLPAQALLPRRAGPPREVDPAPGRARPTPPPRRARHWPTPTSCSTATASR